jgi:hypothetical protein
VDDKASKALAELIHVDDRHGVDSLPNDLALSCEVLRERSDHGHVSSNVRVERNPALTRGHFSLRCFARSVRTSFAPSVT